MQKTKSRSYTKAALDPLQVEKIKKKILNDLRTLEANITELEVLCKPIAPECALGDLARFELMNDQIISEKALKEALLRQKRLYYALSKIDNEDFGLCMECEDAISYERMLLIPETTHCIECASNKSF